MANEKKYSSKNSSEASGIEMKHQIEFYAVRNKAGQWFRAKGFGGTGNSWVGDLDKAKIYKRIGVARGRVSFFAKHYPTYGIPEIVKFICTESEVINEEYRFQKQQTAEKKRAAKKIVTQKEQEIKKAEEELTRAKKYLDALVGAVGRSVQ